MENMIIVFVFIGLFHTGNGAPIVIDNIASYEDCSKIAKAIGGRSVSSINSCYKVNKLNVK